MVKMNCVWADVTRNISVYSIRSRRGKSEHMSSLPHMRDQIQHQHTPYTVPLPIKIHAQVNGKQITHTHAHTHTHVVSHTHESLEQRRYIFHTRRKKKYISFFFFTLRSSLAACQLYVHITIIQYSKQYWAIRIMRVVARV